MKQIFFTFLFLFSFTSFSQIKGADKIPSGGIFLPKNQPSATVVEGNVRRIWKITNGLAKPGEQVHRNLWIITSRGNVTLPNKSNLWLYPEGSALLETARIHVQHPATETKRTKVLSYDFYERGNNIIYNGQWAIKGNKGPALIADLVKPRNFRIIIKKRFPTGRDKNFSFILYVDGQPSLVKKLNNSSSVDVYGKQVAIALSSYPPSPTLQEVKGEYYVWDN